MKDLSIEKVREILSKEITDKGYIIQRAVLERRASLVEKLYAVPAVAEVIR